MNAYQWTVIFAAWLGWGFDCFDAVMGIVLLPLVIETRDTALMD